ncbi:MAG: hypothetical protein D6822_02855 [Cyanobacteria bacterium J149]|nr:MAG: hypothetical protein D6822_02855 [Cyanobacteria bacterium J149]
MSITDKSNKQTVQEILKPLFQYYKEREIKLANMLYERGVTYSEIARELDITPQAARLTYPKLNKANGKGGEDA